MSNHKPTTDQTHGTDSPRIVDRDFATWGCRECGLRNFYDVRECEHCGCERKKPRNTGFREINRIDE